MGMKATVVNFRRGRHNQTMNQLLLEIPGVDTKALASGFIGKRVKWTSPGKLKKEIFGKIVNTHGSNGVVRARFSKGLPGEVVGKKIDILD
ncbi:50S ribosomal protein L35ae [Candidatus Aenigmatarchaeota archaeon]